MPQPLIYLDNSTTAPPSQKAISRMMPLLTDFWGTPTALHQKGQELFPFLSESFKTLYQFLGASEGDQLIFTSSGAEAINHVISAVYRDVTLIMGKNQFVTSSLDEAPAILSMGRLEPLGCVSKMVPANSSGYITAEALADVLSPRTALVSLSWANGLTGVVQSLTEISDLCQQRGILLHIDATHVVGRLFYTLEDIGADFITFNGDQLHAPKGTGVLYVRQGVKCSPFIVGGGEQGGLRAGSLNLPALVGLATAAKEMEESRDYLCTEIARLRDRLEEGILQGYPQATPLFRDQERLPHCTTIAFPGVINEALLFYLNRRGICATIGGGHFQQLSLLLNACQLPDSLAQSALSFSLSRYTTEEEIERAIILIVEAAQLLQKMGQQITTPKELSEAPL